MAKSTVISFPVKVAVFVSPYRVTRPSGIEDCGSTRRERRVSLVSSPSSSRIERKLKLAWKFYSDTISGRISTNFRHARRNKSLIVEHRARLSWRSTRLVNCLLFRVYFAKWWGDTGRGCVQRPFLSH